MTKILQVCHNLKLSLDHNVQYKFSGTRQVAFWSLASTAFKSHAECVQPPPPLL